MWALARVNTASIQRLGEIAASIERLKSEEHKTPFDE